MILFSTILSTLCLSFLSDEEDEEDEKSWPPHRVGTPEPPLYARFPSVNPHLQDLMDNSRYVTAESVLSDYGKPGNDVYFSYISVEELPSPRLVEDECEDDDEPAYYDWSEIEHGGTFPPPKIFVDISGTMDIMDGNHRIKAWESQGYTYIPAWVIQQRS